MYVNTVNSDLGDTPKLLIYTRKLYSCSNSFSTDSCLCYKYITKIRRVSAPELKIQLVIEGKWQQKFLLSHLEETQK